jgi:predicted MPP superfamily phosphohydrolase
VLNRRNFIKGASFSAVGSLGFTKAGYSNTQGLPGLRRMVFDFSDLPEPWDGLTILQISDVHAGPYMTPERMHRVRDLANSLPADLIVFTGDQIDRRRMDSDLFVEGFRGISAPLGVYGVLGNHDYRVSPRRAVATLEEAGITPLVNQTAVIERGGEGLAIAGVDDFASPSLEGPDFTILRNHPDVFRLMLCHQPQGWDIARNEGAQLTLAGHTHGGQIALPTRNFNPARVYTRYIAGPYATAHSLLYVSRGIGVGAVPLRVGSPPEMDLITLRRTAQTSVAAA